MDSDIRAHFSWIRQDYDASSNTLVHQSSGENTLTNFGKSAMFLNTLIGFQGASSLFPYLAVGASGINNGLTASASDVTLFYEITGNGVRKSFVSTRSSNPPLSSADVTVSNVTIGGYNYTILVQGQATFGTTDATNGYVLGEYALATNVNCPTTPTGQSGNIYNHYLDPSPQPKSSSQITVITGLFRL